MKAKKFLAVVIAAVMLVSVFAIDSFAAEEKGSIKKLPNQLYEVGGEFNPKGMELTVGSATKKYATASHKKNFRFRKDEDGTPFTDKNGKPIESGEGIALSDGEGNHVTQIHVFYEGVHCGEVKLTLLELTGKKLENSFFVDDAFDPAGIEVTVYTSDGTKKVTPATDDNLTTVPAAGTALKTTNTAATVKYKVESKTLTFGEKVTININKLNKLPSGFKTEYTVGEYFNPIGLSVSYNGEIIEYPNADFSFEPSLDTPLTLGEVDFEVFFKGTSYGWVNNITVTGLTSGPSAEFAREGKKLDPKGLATEYGGATVRYSDDPANFSFSPSIESPIELKKDVDGNILPVNYTVYYKGYEVGSFEMAVNHDFDDYVQLESGKEHAKICKQCGELVDLERCEDSVHNFKANDDAGFFKLQTETGTCDKCGGTVTRNIEGSNKFDNIFDYVHEDGMAATELTILTYFKLILVSLIQMIIPV